MLQWATAEMAVYASIALVSLPALCRHHLLITLASLRDIVVIVASLLYPASLSSTALANLVVCDSLRKHRAGNFASVVLALSPSSRGRLCTTLQLLRRRCCTRPCCHQLCWLTSLPVVVTSGVVLVLSPSWRWRLCRLCAGVITLVTLASACSRPQPCMWHCCHTGVIVKRGLVAVHAAHNLVITCGVIIALDLFLCTASLPYMAFCCHLRR
jgi:hypothetical protein